MELESLELISRVDLFKIGGFFGVVVVMCRTTWKASSTTVCAVLALQIK